MVKPPEDDRVFWRGKPQPPRPDNGLSWILPAVLFALALAAIVAGAVQRFVL